MATITATINDYPELVIKLANIQNRYYDLEEKYLNLQRTIENIGPTAQTDNTDLSIISDANGGAELQYDSDFLSVGINNSLMITDPIDTLLGYQDQDPIQEWPSFDTRITIAELQDRNRQLETEGEKMRQYITDAEGSYEEVVQENKDLLQSLNETKRINDRLRADIENVSAAYEDNILRLDEMQATMEKSEEEKMIMTRARNQEMLLLEGTKQETDNNLSALERNYELVSQQNQDLQSEFEKIVSYLQTQMAINTYMDADSFLSKVDSVLRSSQNVLTKYEQVNDSLRAQIENLESSTVEKSLYENLVQILQERLGIRSYVSVDDLLFQLKNAIEKSIGSSASKDRLIAEMQEYISDLEMNTEEKDKKIQKIIDKLVTSTSTELKNIDTEIAMYQNVDDMFKSNPLNIDDFVTTYDYPVTNQINLEYIPFLKYISRRLNAETHGDISDFDDINNINPYTYHAYIVVILKLMELFSKKYISSYLDYVYQECEKASRTPTQILQLPKLVLPQTFQINSLYYLMNRYNSKIYQPDRVVDFGDFLFNFLKPEFRPDETQALNLFQPGIGKRYNSILIYSEETIKLLQDLKNKLNSK